MNLYYISSDFINIKVLRKVPVYYFYREKNVGDLLTPYLVNKITGKATHNVKSRRFRHILGVGSVIHRAKKYSDIWGTGTLDRSIGSQYNSEDLNVLALRGYLSADVLSCSDVDGKKIALGDPGVLMPDFFKPKVEEEFKVGVIPHYIDSDSEFIVDRPDVHVIDVSSEPEAFVVELMRCEYIISSSLHGLILADAYGVKNKWVSFSEKVTGGGFKFQDYYSTTDSKDEVCEKIGSRAEFLNLISRIEDCATVKLFLESKEQLLSSFPARYL